MKKIRKMRLVGGYTLKEIADKLDCSIPALCMYEHGKRPLPVYKARRLADIYGCAWYELYEDEEDGKAVVS